MLNLQFDLNLLFNRFAHSLAPRPPKVGQPELDPSLPIFLDRREEQIQLVQNVHQSLVQDASKYRGLLSRVLLIQDSGESWRKSLPKVSDPRLAVGDEGGYKSGRKRSPTFRYGILMDLVNEYVEYMNRAGMLVLSYPGAEGDDLLAVATSVLYDELGECVAMVTSDSDMRQLVRGGGSSDPFVVVYDADYNKRCHYVAEAAGARPPAVAPEPLPQAEEDPFNGIFSMTPDTYSFGGTAAPRVQSGSGVRQTLRDRIEQVGEQVLDPYLFAFRKMLAGDGGDTVPSTLYYQPVTKKGELGKVTRFTEGRAESLYAKMGRLPAGYFRQLYHDEPQRRELASRVLAEVGCVEVHRIPEVAERIRQNLQLTLLDPCVYEPREFGQRMRRYVQHTLCGPALNRHRQILRLGAGLQPSLLEGTPFQFPDQPETRDFNTRYNY